MIREARVERAIAAYLGFDTKVTCPGDASSIPVTPVTVGLSLAFSSFPPRRCANSCSFMGAILVGPEEKQNTTRIARIHGNSRLKCVSGFKFRQSPAESILVGTGFAET